MARLALLLLGLIGIPAVHADVDIADYGTRESVGSGSEQARIRASIATERALEAARERRELTAQERRLAEERVALAARPYPVRLTEARCTRCHAAAHYMSQRHGWLGWTLVTMRMKYLNGASDITEADRTVIVDDLATRLPASAANAWLEHLAAAALVAALVAVSAVAIWLRRKKKRLTGTTTIPEEKDAHR